MIQKFPETIKPLRVLSLVSLEVEKLIHPPRKFLERNAG